MDAMKTDVENSLSGLGNIALTSTGEIPKATKQNLDESARVIKQFGTDAYLGVKTSFSKLEEGAKQSMTNLYKGVSTSMTKTKTNVMQDATAMYNQSKKSFSALEQSAKSSFSNLYNGCTNSMKKLKNSVISDWNSIRNTLSKGITGKVTVTRTTQYRTETASKQALTQAMNEDDKTKLMEVMKVAVVDGSTSNIKTNVYKHLRDSGEQEVTIGNIDQIVEDIARDTGMRDHVTDAQFDEIKDRVRTTHNYTERSYVEQVKNVADEIHRNFIEVKFDGDPAIDVVNTMDEIEGINQRAKKEAKRKVTDVERLITDLRVRE